ncbi:Hpt domain-containing protein [Natroniella sulfidigena]|uniref:Hpt domain-containing protein n=1 Tax=Natroniella sulfidigena TaxID=723921 RepID=UPI002009FC3E|nr:Hpt domain-containing protein [Natroniella sulfidigena]MCK8818029.1 Hpt domain-containing protein [Natroniella sulfidigena]
MKGDKVYVDRDLKALIPQFMNNRKEEVKQLKELFATDNLEEIESLSHAIKGTGGGYGFDKVTELGRKIEQAAAQEKREQIKESITELEEHLEMVEIIYK